MHNMSALENKELLSNFKKKLKKCNKYTSRRTDNNGLSLYASFDEVNKSPWTFEKIKVLIFRDFNHAFVKLWKDKQ